MASFRISVFNSKELQGVIVAMQGFEPELNKQIRKATKKVVEPEWRAAVEKRAVTDIEKQVLGSTARATVSNQNVTLTSASIGRSLSGGLKPSESFAGVEFGANPAVRKRVKATSTKGKKYSVTRHTQRQLAPRRKTGYVVMPAVAEIIPRIAALWVQTTVRTFYDLIEKK